MYNYQSFRKGGLVTFKQKQYQVLEVFPQGIQGTVIKIQEENKEDQFALKIINEITEKELQITQQLQKNHHQNIVKIIDFQKQQNKVYILMECCEHNLYQELKKNPLDQKELRYFMISIARGLKYLHSHSIIHRDLKPENILITTLTEKNNKQLQQRVYKIADFGLSLQQQRAQTKYVGTCYYMAPELIINLDQPYDHKVDIWSFGTIVYEILTGKTLFQGRSTQEIYNQIKSQCNIENQKELNQKLQIIKDKNYLDLVTNMLKYDPNERFNIDQVISELQNKDQNIIKNRSVSCNVTVPKDQQQVQFTLNNQIIWRPAQKLNFPITLPQTINKPNNIQIGPIYLQPNNNGKQPNYYVKCFKQNK
ncbi:unnamed protein product (macronuclear) [Paramecium tetraurelia]|uniref:Protein kinase domain-containing protein n=1 Tax=Paramecium tetraurelia TaxID=5888 RepID=A0EHN0_PARTE|nr:uncharacterized protein GSPATT00027147001 [Paramecium tetraurelia]CAK94821.1 unnamed protein product [Paramecium tetraurelia]|eukprot:XP_001462194.1 hypothetical protein (macronuclear) [Paramecium tetraurelia strain d4-2]